jgi:purine-binding chemotaxis protein CheW
LSDREADLLLICRVQSRLCGLPLEHVLETMRPLPTEGIAGAADFVRGLAVIRGAPVPVIDTARLLGVTDAQADRFVTVNAGERGVALAVDSVLGVSAVPAVTLRELPPLLHDAAAQSVAAIGLLDAQLLLVLHSACLLPDEAWGASVAPGAGA